MSVSPSKSMPPVTQIALVVGPMEPATQRGRPSAASAASAASRASSAARALIRSAWSSSPYSPSTSGVPPKVSVSVTSAPASK